MEMMGSPNSIFHRCAFRHFFWKLSKYIFHFINSIKCYFHSTILFVSAHFKPPCLFSQICVLSFSQSFCSISSFYANRYDLQSKMQTNVKTKIDILKILYKSVFSFSYSFSILPQFGQKFGR